MTGQLDIIREAHLGIIALNRPQAINALSLEMVEGVSRALESWREDDGIRAVLFEGNGERGFCSGGDVRAARQAVLEGRPQDADAYFAAEYAMNRNIATYPKPLVALTHGIVMGGGIGIAGHCRFRFATSDARFAMPEAAIGFVVDVGVNAILAQAELHRALLFLMSGLAVGPADAQALGLTDCIIAPERRGAVRDGIAAAVAGDHLDTALVSLMRAEEVPEGEATFCALADRVVGSARWSSAGEIVAGLGSEPDLAVLARRSPTSLEAIVQSHLAARRLPDVAKVLEQDLRLATLMARLPDFAEGVRAVLVDKDQNARWQPPDFASVPAAAIAAAIARP